MEAALHTKGLFCFLCESTKQVEGHVRSTGSPTSLLTSETPSSPHQPQLPPMECELQGGTHSLLYTMGQSRVYMAECPCADNLSVTLVGG